MNPPNPAPQLLTLPVVFEAFPAPLAATQPTPLPWEPMPQE
jgi:hypothetical protein